MLLWHIPVCQNIYNFLFPPINSIFYGTMNPVITFIRNCLLLYPGYSALRLDRYVSESLGISRKESSRIIRHGEIEVNGIRQKSSSFSVSDEDRVCRNGEELLREDFVYLMMNKPIGVLSASEDSGGLTARDLVKDDFPRRNLYPAGRLDKDSTGLLLLTDDGTFAHFVTSPKRHVAKNYIVSIDSPATENIIEGFKNGIVLPDGEVLKSAELRPLSPDGLTCQVTISQGVYHQIKRMFGVYGIGVNSLHRISIGGLVLPQDLAPGEYKKLSPEDLVAAGYKKFPDF